MAGFRGRAGSRRAASAAAAAGSGAATLVSVPRRQPRVLSAALGQKTTRERGREKRQPDLGGGMWRRRRPSPRLRLLPPRAPAVPPRHFPISSSLAAPLPSTTPRTRARALGFRVLARAKAQSRVKWRRSTGNGEGTARETGKRCGLGRRQRRAGRPAPAMREMGKMRRYRGRR